MSDGNRPLWVRLYLVPQTDNANTMPPYVEGLLIKETTSSYVLNPLLERQQDHNTGEPYSSPAGMNFINKTYVWRCNILENKPEASEAPAVDFEEDEGGLG